MAEATLSSKNQIVVPAEARKALKVKAGDKIVVTVVGDGVIMLKRPTAYSEAIKGIGRGVYPPDYLKKEREDWD